MDYNDDVSTQIFRLETECNYILESIKEIQELRKECVNRIQTIDEKLSDMFCQVSKKHKDIVELKQLQNKLNKNN